ncbi:hypothetical protein INF70_21775, partial [Enterobacter cloacae complex sp. P4RS]
GIETDVRDYCGKLVISHDIPLQTGFTLEALFAEYKAMDASSILALNIKSDGLALHVKEMLIKYGISNYFCFDMSVPDTIAYMRAGLKVASRISEYEPEGLLTELTNTIWLDGFNSSGLNIESLLRWLDDEKSVCVVSPELHGRDPTPLWSELKCIPRRSLLLSNIMLCTDLPEQAQEFFR